MKKPEEMSSMVSVLNQLKSKGWDKEFRMAEIGFICDGDENKVYKPEELEIIETYRFEGDSNPSDSSIIYIIKAKDSSVTGYCIDSYGAYSNGTRFDEFIKQISINRKEEHVDSNAGTIDS